MTITASITRASGGRISCRKLGRILVGDGTTLVLDRCIAPHKCVEEECGSSFNTLKVDGGAFSAIYGIPKFQEGSAYFASRAVMGIESEVEAHLSDSERADWSK
ncbi:hypothetical protein PM082_006332 [Marasmius tenuissimus]|nr:hypothetical protein PM082_006332 [Marasmius tenuissimus]